MLEPVLAITGSVLVLGGLALATVGVIGLILKPDLFEQLHAAGLITGSGVVLVLLASVGTGSAEIVTSAILVAAFVLVTSSISTHAIAWAGVRRYGAADGATEGAAGEGAAGRPAATAREAATAPRGAVAPPAAAATPPGGPAAARPEPSEARARHPGQLRIVVAHDGSDGADVAAALAAGLDLPPGTMVRIVRAAATDPMPSADAIAAPGASGAADTDTPGPGSLEDVVAAIERPGVQVETAVVRGDPADVVIDQTFAFGADLLITGSRRRNFIQALLGWSAAGDIVDRAPCPVLVARTAEIRTVLLTTDGSPQSAAATELVARWPVFDVARVRVVTVAPETPAPARRIGGASTSEEQRIADIAAARLMDAGREVVTEVLHGRPAARIVEAARSRAADLIVIGSRGRTGLGRTLLGSVAGEVLASAACSVLIVTPPPRRPVATTAPSEPA